MKLNRKTPPPSPKIETTSPPKSPASSVKGGSSPGPSRTNSVSSPSTSAPAKKQDNFDTGSPRPSRRPSNASTEQVNGPDASGAKKPTTNADIRKWYVDKVATIPELDKQWAAQGVSMEERAKRAVAIRHDARLEARKMMSSPLEVAMLRARDFFTYGSINGPSFDQLVKKAEGKGLRGEDVFKELIGSSNRTNQTVNQHLLGQTGTQS
ncbi:hypothetical protein [Pyxidicoccus sp. MSG2]|uniref:hypothetical protein n=1 Tax=Pyxidicoccus sp. MSG2 TaxID=2996790 RepID=UPI002271AF80|nr:hypothetical protein [Pyxidicoccus sp. MSG2]MCY1020174.1 hypothetical protein [Pyxidicoccus sp. MSG2]